MKYEEYINKLNTEDDDFEVGMLSDLKQKPPINLHSEIMKTINKEKKKPAYLNYKIYAPLVAAALVIAVVINNNDIVKGTNLLKIFKSPNDSKVATNIKPATNNDSEDMLNDIAQLKQHVIATAKDQNTNGSTNTILDGTVTAANDKTQSSGTDKVATKGTADNKGSNNAGAEASDINGLKDIVAVRYETVNYEISLETPQSSIINFLTNKANCKQVDINEYMMNNDKFNAFNDLLTVSQINKTLLHKVSEDYVVVKLTAVNYQIIADANVNDAVNIIKEHNGQYVKNNIYKISKKDYDALIKALPKDAYNLKPVNDVFNDYVMLKILPVNYELDLNGANDEITGYIANKDNAQPLSNNIYKLTKDSLTTFEQLLSNAGIVKTTINEPSDGNIIVKTN